MKIKFSNEQYLSMVEDWLSERYTTKTECARAYGFERPVILVDVFNPKYLRRAVAEEVIKLCYKYYNHKDSQRLLSNSLIRINFSIEDISE